MIDAHDVDAWVSEHVPDILFFITALFLLQIGLRLWAMLPPSSVHATLAVILHFAWGLFLIVLTVLEVDTGRHGHRLTLATVAIVIYGAVSIIIAAPETYISTDVLLFSRHSAHLTIAGENPYQHSMLPAVSAVYDQPLTAPGSMSTIVTPKTNGAVVEYASYPAGSFLVFIPQAVTGLGRPEYMSTLLAPAAITLALLVRYSPPELAPLGVLAMIGGRNILISSVGGLNDIWWVLPVIVAMLFWYHERWLAAGMAFGLAAAIKQQPWFMAPFLAIWIYKASPTVRVALRRLTQFAGSALAVFLGVNLPYILWGPEAWLRGVFTPLRQTSGSLVTQGTGLALLTTADVWALPKGYYLLLMASWTAVLLALYTLYWPRVRWMAWLVPGLILIVNYRSLPSYIVYMAPLAYTAWLLHTDLYWTGDYVRQITATSAPNRKPGVAHE